MAEDKIETKNKQKNSFTSAEMQSLHTWWCVPPFSELADIVLAETLYRDWMKTFGSEFQEVVRVHQRLRTTLTQQRMVEGGRDVL